MRRTLGDRSAPTTADPAAVRPNRSSKCAASPHDFSLRPSDARRIQEAHVVFLVAESLETSLAGPIDTLAADAHVVELAAADGLVRRPLRAGATFEAHDHGGHGDDADHEGDAGDHERDDHAAAEDEHHGDDHNEDEAKAAGEHEDDDHAAFDLHVWLDPHNAAAMTRAIAATLSSADPENMDAYMANAAAFAARLDALTQRIATQTAAVRGQPFIVFHDAYGHGSGTARHGCAAASLPVRRRNPLPVGPVPPTPPRMASRWKNRNPPIRYRSFASGMLACAGQTAGSSVMSTSRFCVASWST